jgi:hypothetical protein
MRTAQTTTIAPQPLLQPLRPRADRVRTGGFHYLVRERIPANAVRRSADRVSKQVDLAESGVVATVGWLGPPSGYRSAWGAEDGELVGDLQALALESEQRRRAAARPSGSA